VWFVGLLVWSVVVLFQVEQMNYGGDHKKMILGVDAVGGGVGGGGGNGRVQWQDAVVISVL
jgi:hypothetical protein